MKNAFKILSRILLALVIISAALSLVIYTFNIFAYLFISVLTLFAGAVM